MSVKFIIMLSDAVERVNNVENIRREIPNLYIYKEDNDNVFNKFVNCFKLESNYTGLVLLEDDIKLCYDFYNKITKIINSHNDDVISFFEKPNSKKTLTTKYNNGYEFLYNQCNYYPKTVCDLIWNSDNVAEFKNTYFIKNKVWIAPTDLYIAFVLDKYKLKYLMQVPFLVQHLHFKSTLGKRSTKRQTRFFIDDYEKNSN